MSREDLINNLKIKQVNSFSAKYLIPLGEHYEGFFLKIQLSDGALAFLDYSLLMDMFYISQRYENLRLEVQGMLLELIQDKYLLSIKDILGTVNSFYGYCTSVNNYALYFDEVTDKISKDFFSERICAITDRVDRYSLTVNINFEIGFFYSNKIKNNLFEINKTFKCFIENKLFSSFYLGCGEVMLTNEKNNNIPDGFTRELFCGLSDLEAKFTICLGEVKMTFQELESLYVGSFINISHLSVKKIQVFNGSKLVAVGELVMDEKEQLLIDITEIY